MALRIGANTVMYSVIRAVFLRPLPFPRQDRPLKSWERDAARGIDERRVAPANFVDWRAESRLFEELGVLYYALGIPADLAYEVEKRTFHVTKDGKGKPVMELFA